MPNPVDHPKLYTSFKLAGRRSPGKCTFNFPTRDRGWDVQVPKGSTGGNTVLNNSKPIEFDVEIYLWKGDDELGADVDHFERWDAFKDVFAISVKPTDPKGLDIYHPQLEGTGVKSVVVKSGPTDPQPDGKGGATVRVKFLEFRPAKAAPSKSPFGSSEHGTSVGNAKKPDPNQALKDEVARLTAAYQRAG